MNLISNKVEKRIIYDDILGQAESKIMSISRNLGVDKLSFLKRQKSKIVYYDTPDHLLTGSGILLSKEPDDDEGYIFKIERLNFLPSISTSVKSPVFKHKIQLRDEPIQHSYYIISGITSLFSTVFTIDIEHVLKRARPVYEIEIESLVYRAFKSNGFKCLVCFDKVLYNNMETKIKKINNEVRVEFIGLKSLTSEFNQFVEKLEKYCKDIVEKKESRFEFAQRFTKPVVKAPTEKAKNTKPKKTNK